MDRLINVLDPEIAKQQRESALEKLQKAQFSNGAFPWFAGGPPSPYMTLYLVHGFAKAQELKKQKALAVRETAKIAAGPIKREFVFEPDRYSGDKAQVVIPAPDITPAMAKTVVSKTGPGYLFASATWHYSTEKLPTQARGDFLAVTRQYFLRKHQGEEYTLSPIAEGATVEVRDQVEVHLSIRAKHQMEYIHLRDPRGAGFEPESQVSGHRWDLGISWYEEVRDSGMNFFFEWLPQGEYTFKYRIRANMAGKFRVGPATIQSMYAPEFAGFSDGAILEVK